MFTARDYTAWNDYGVCLKGLRPVMIPFTYGDFYDVPRHIVFTHGGSLYLLTSVFDEQRNDHADYYSVYKAPLSARDQVSVPPKDFINNHGSIGAQLMGEVPVRDMLFDKTLRNELDVVVVEKHIFRGGRALKK
jgi:hypothetical protein